MERTSSLPFGGTDCSLPMTYALANRWEVDTFIVLTDNETWAELSPKSLDICWRADAALSEDTAWAAELLLP